MIDFELSPRIKGTKNMIHMFAESAVRPIARQYDEQEHEKQDAPTALAGRERSRPESPLRALGRVPRQRRHGLLGRRRGGLLVTHR